MGARRNSGPQPIRTLGELAALVERDPGTVSRWTKREDWPFARKAPWARSDVPKILRWVADTLERDTRPVGTAAGAPAEEKDEAKRLRLEKLREEVRKLRAQADQAETALARERGQLYDADEVDHDRVRDAVTVSNAFGNLPSQLVPLALSHGMPHEAAGVFHEQIAEAVSAILRRLSSGGDDGSEIGEDSAAEVLSGVAPEGEVDAGRVGGELPDAVAGGVG